MKVGLGRVPGPPLLLPVEIVEVIVDYVARRSESQSRQGDLWSLCLVSRDWYSVSVPHLYSRPVLGPRNFELFTRTLCPPVNSRVRAIGLEDLVKELHLGDLAYVTSRSMTARLLRRTRTSLTTLVTPSHSMSTSSLAPISKMASLQHLDLSRDKYDFDICALTRAVQPVTTLRFLSLPRGILNTYPDSPASGRCAWSPALEYLEVNNTVPHLQSQWRNFITGLPQSLRILSFQHLRQNTQFGGIIDLGVEAPQVASLAIQGAEGVDCMLFNGIDLSALLQVFPGLIELTLPETALLSPLFYSYREEKFGILGRRLQALRFRVVQALGTPGPTGIVERALVDLAASFAQIQSIEISTAYAFASPTAVSASHELLQQRWPQEPKEAKGIFIVGQTSGTTSRWRWNPMFDEGTESTPSR
ncbi:uncharacterized protein HMPREF1541_04340 [Cyphellophora europaea CBS 101466]|uniref:Uncharacterized protein n=1 Tax=Cyphellophora europaea (strain CBS 101466) TaxID=1220924 RepID=W2RUT2_CYPE1|nr:uncharacterized protein HMPREF1541_04340 [Cyphellophora europaea CBS 101466]ETN40065.1 hypothetical protein HMPREF1541_04340 [Cyphellophora europaea CBS 101466]